MRHLFIINPTAGKEDASPALTPYIARCMEPRGLPYEIVKTQGPGHAAQLARRAAGAGGPVILYACGGDGTLNEVVWGAAEFQNAAVTQIPCGSGNDFLRLFQGGGRPFTDLEGLLEGTLLPLDLVESCGRYALNVCSVGIDARVTAKVGALKRLPLMTPSRAYFLSLAYNMAKGLHHAYRITVDGEVLDGRYTLIAVCNGQYYGSGYHPVPGALPNDGMLDVLMVRAVSRLRAARVVGKYKEGRWRELEDLAVYRRARRVEVEASSAVPVNLDGEIVPASRAVFQLSQRRLPFLVPKGVHLMDENKSIHEISGASS